MQSRRSHSGALRSAHATPAVRKALFPSRRTSARARTHRRRRRRRIVVEFTRARESPLRPRLKILNAKGVHVERRSRSRERPFTPRLRREVVVHASSSVARAAGDGGTPLDDGDDAGTSSLPLSTHTTPHSRARAARAVYISGGMEKKKEGNTRHESTLAWRRDATRRE